MDELELGISLICNGIFFRAFPSVEWYELIFVAFTTILVYLIDSVRSHPHVISLIRRNSSVNGVPVVLSTVNHHNTV